jgi:hypothetical protein
MSRTTVVNVATKTEVNSLVTEWTSKGFTVTSRTEENVSMKKMAAENVAGHIPVIGLGLICCIVPGLAAIVYYGLVVGDQFVIINLDPDAVSAVPTPGLASGGTADGVPPGATVSEDGFYWWDGAVWQPIQGKH